MRNLDVFSEGVEWLASFVAVVISIICCAVLFLAGLNPSADSFYWVRLGGIFYCIVALLSIIAGVALAEARNLFYRFERWL